MFWLGNPGIRSSRPAAAKSSSPPYEYGVEDNPNFFAAEFPRKCKVIFNCKLYSDDDYYCFYCMSNYILITLYNDPWDATTANRRVLTSN